MIHWTKRTGGAVLDRMRICPGWFVTTRLTKKEGKVVLENAAEMRYMKAVGRDMDVRPPTGGKTNG
jgi:hypothetical protein